MKKFLALALLMPASLLAAEGDIPIEQAGGAITTQTVSGDATITAAGVVSITDNAISPDNLAAVNFGDFTCDGTNCALNDTFGAITSSTGAPVSTPTVIGSLHVDTSTPALYFASGTTDSGDWSGPLSAGGSVTVPWQHERTITDPADTDDWLWFKAKAALTLTAVDCVAQGTTPSITVDIQECDSDGANCSSNLSAAVTCNGGNDSGTISDSAIDSGDWVKMLLGAPSGTVDAISVQVSGTRAL